MSRIAFVVLAAASGLSLARGAQAQPPAPPPADAAPDLEFLEYLGSWPADDDEWLAIREWEKDNPPAAADEEDKKDGGGATPPPRSRNDDDKSK